MVYLHILNGDSIVPHLRESGLSGEHLVWREMLAEGPASAEVGSPAFWEKRSSFFETWMGRPAPEYLDSFRPEWQTLQTSRGEELVLWFEYDLFCQINLMAVLAALTPIQPNWSRISLICLGEWPGRDGLTGLGELTPGDFPALFEARKNLSQEDLEWGKSCWEAWCGEDHRALYPFIEQKTPAFPYLAPALKTHLKRFPYTTDGLTEIERTALQIIDRGGKTRRKVVGELLQWQNWYGFGDLQFEWLLVQIEDLFLDSEGDLAINGAGRQVLDGRAPYYLRRTTPYYMGGANKWDFAYDPESSKLVNKT